MPLGHEDVVLTLLRGGAVWKQADSQWQKTALHMAAMKGHAQLIKIVIQLDPNQVREKIDVN